MVIERKAFSYPYFAVTFGRSEIRYAGWWERASMKYQLAGLTLTSLSLFAALALIRPHAQEFPRTPGDCPHTGSGRAVYIRGAALAVLPRMLCWRGLAEEPLDGECAVDRPGGARPITGTIGLGGSSLRETGHPAKCLFRGTRNANPYTPQMVVGRDGEFVGSHGRRRGRQF